MKNKWKIFIPAMLLSAMLLAGAITTMERIKVTAASDGDTKVLVQVVSDSGSISLYDAAQAVSGISTSGSTGSLRLDADSGNAAATSIIDFKVDGASGMILNPAGLTVDTTTLVVDAPNNRVGVGTATPLLKLDVAGSGRFTGAATSVLTGSIDPTASTAVVGVGTLFTTELVVGDRITVNAETRTVTAITDATHLTVDIAFTNTANDTSPDKLAAIFLARDSAGAVKMAMNDLGYVGIGTASPRALLGVNGSMEIGMGTTGYIRNYNMTRNGYGYIKLYDTSTGGVEIGTTYFTGDIVLTPGASGFVGIGTPTPAEKLDVVGNIDASGNINADGEIKGSRQSTVFSKLTTGAMYASAYYYLKLGEVQTSADKGLTAIRAGSIVGVSINYDVTTTGATNQVLSIMKNGTPVWSVTLDKTAANNVEAYATQARGTDAFAAGDTIVVEIYGVANMVMENIIVNLEYVYDN